MNQSTAERYAVRNTRLYVVLKIFHKRVFLPVVIIYFIDQIGFSIQEIGWLAALYALVGLIFNIPTGYIADKVGRARSLRLAGVLLIVASLVYVFTPTKWAVVLAQIIEAIGYSFLIGAGEAIVHDSLEVTGKVKHYSKVLARAQSIALLANALLVATIPLTYAIDPRLPFLIGAGAYGIALVAALGMRDVQHAASLQQERIQKLSGLWHLRGKHRLITAAVLFGVVGAIYFASDIYPLALREFGLRPEYLGWVFAGSSIVGAVIGLVVHHLKKLSIGGYIVVDMMILLLQPLAAFSGNLYFLIASVILTIGFWRFRRIIYQDHVLERYKTAYKATLISALNMAENLNSLWVPIATTSAVAYFGLQHGFGVIAAAIILLAVPYYLSVRALFRPPVAPKEAIL